MRRACWVLVLVLLIGSLAVSFGSIGAASKWTGTIQVWDFPRPAAAEEWELQAFKEFEELHPGVKIEYTKLTWAGGNEKLDVSVAAGQPPDICGSGLRLPYVLQGALEPIDDFLTAEDLKDFHEGSLNAVKLNGKYWGWPWYNTLYVMYLNADIFNERGVPLPKNGEWTWDEFLSAMQKLTFDRDGDGKIDVYGFGFTFQPTYLQPFGFIYAEGGRSP
jgi:multiple sugar transport system substrate-binding protein